MHPTVVVAAACVASVLAKFFFLTHGFATPTLVLPVRVCRDAPSAVLHLGVGPAPRLEDLPSALDGVEVVLVVDDGVRHERLIAILDELARRGASVVLEARTGRCRR